LRNILLKLLCEEVSLFEVKAIKQKLKKLISDKFFFYIVVFILSVGAAVVVIGYVKDAKEMKEKSNVRGNLKERFYKEADLIYNEREFIEDKQLVNVLVIGTDQTNQEARRETGYGRGGQADFISLVTIDEANGKVYCLAIDRDTMTDIDVYGAMGDKTGTLCQQICLSYGFGTGREESCELTTEAVSKLLLGIQIDYYASINMDAIPILNDTLGGVTVTLEQDLTGFDPQMGVGKKLILTGQQANYYVRSRLGIQDSTNMSRMERQNKYLISAYELIRKKLGNDKNISEKLYQALKEYLITNMNKTEFINLINTASSYEDCTIDYIQGEHLLGSDGFMEFYADECALHEVVLERFYIQK
jgi:LCP family protein required for cell wall assembly